MRIILVSFYAVTNIGDKILTQCVSKFLKDKGHSVKIVDLNGRSIIEEDDTCDIRLKKQRQSEQIKSDRNRYIEYFIQELSFCDLVLFAGGAILDVRSEGVAENILSIVSLAKERNIPVGFNSAGFFGSDLDGESGQILRKALLSSNVKWISVRERAVDMSYLLEGQKPFSVCCDPAVWAKEIYDIERHTTIDGGGSLVGINLISEIAYAFSENGIFDIRQTYNNLYLKLTDLGYECRFFINGPQRDIEFAKSFMEQFHIPANLMLPDSITKSGKAFLSSLSKFSFVISSRLHTSICCYSLRIPSFCLSWDMKMNEFYKNIGRDEWVLRDNEVDYIAPQINSALTIRYDDSQYNTYRNTVVEYLDSILHQIR